MSLSAFSASTAPHSLVPNLGKGPSDPDTVSLATTERVAKTWEKTPKNVFFVFRSNTSYSHHEAKKNSYD